MRSSQKAFLIVFGCMIALCAYAAIDSTVRDKLNYLMDGRLAFRTLKVDGEIIGSSAVGRGSVPSAVSAYVKAVHTGGAEASRVTLTLSAMPVVIAEGGTGTNGFGGTQIYDFEEGVWSLEGCTIDTTVAIATNLVNDGSGINCAIGTVTAIASTGAVAHTSTRADLCPNVQVDPWTNGSASTDFNQYLTAALYTDGSAAASDAYYNVLVDDGDIATAVTGTVSGTIIFTKKFFGDY